MSARLTIVFLMIASFGMQHVSACLYLQQLQCNTTTDESCEEQECDIMTNTCDDKVHTEDTSYHLNGYTTTNNGTQGYDRVVAPLQTPCGVTYDCEPCDVDELEFSGTCGAQLGENETWIDKWDDWQPTGLQADLCP